MSRRVAPLLALVLGALATWLALRSSPSRTVTARGDLAAEERSTIEVFRHAAPAVVYITTVHSNAFTLNVTEVPRGTGSGFIWDDQGHVVTNLHVVSRAAAVQVTLDDRSTWPATLVGEAPDVDLAVLRIQSSRDLVPIAVGASDNLQVGQKVLAIGNPFGLDHSLTVGVVSALDRSIESITGRGISGVIQTDASINPGNSGGPLLDSAGRLIGVNTAIKSLSGASAGIGFAVPVDTVRRVVPQLIRYGKLVRPRLGVQVASDVIARRIGLEGVLVLEVELSSVGPSALRGTGRDRQGRLVLGDEILRLGTHSVRSTSDLSHALEQHGVGDDVAVVFRRDGEVRETRARLAPPAGW